MRKDYKLSFEGCMKESLEVSLYHKGNLIGYVYIPTGVWIRGAKKLSDGGVTTEEIVSYISTEWNKKIESLDSDICKIVGENDIDGFDTMELSYFEDTLIRLIQENIQYK